MSVEGEGRANRRGEPRVPFDGAVRLRYRLFHEFLEENAANISAGGMFIRTIHPGEPGSEMEFEIRLEDDFTLIRGRAEVTWVRRSGQVPGAEPGMGIRFLSLPEESQALVDKIVSERVAAGLELFDLEREAPEPEANVPRSVPDTPAGFDPELPAAPGAWPGQTPAGADRRVAAAGRVSAPRLIALAVLSALLGAGAVLTYYLLHVQPSIDALEMRIEELAGNPGGPWRPPTEEPRAVEVSGAEAAAEESSSTTSRPGRTPDVVEALRGWAAAWSEQRADDYLACYSAEFVPPDGLGRAAWEESRRARIARPRWIRVALTLVEVESAGPEAAEVSFVQSYRSERYKDLVRKRVRLVLEEGAWKIAAERVVAQ